MGSGGWKGRGRGRSGGSAGVGPDVSAVPRPPVTLRDPSATSAVSGGSRGFGGPCEGGLAGVPEGSKLSDREGPGSLREPGGGRGAAKVPQGGGAGRGSGDPFQGRSSPCRRLRAVGAGGGPGGGAGPRGPPGPPVAPPEHRHSGEGGGAGPGTAGGGSRHVLHVPLPAALVPPALRPGLDEG